MNRNRILVLAGALFAALVPIGAWAFFKPVRIIAPQLNGVTCVDSVCVDDMAALPAAQQLHSDARSNVARKLRPLRVPPRTVFCSTRACYESFGGIGRGITVLHLGVVIPPESWQTYIVEHEFIHMLQAQELGLRGRERTPAWFKEGMPFFVSAPPSFDLPDYARPLVGQYAAWERRVGRENVWTEFGGR
ncbi:hypothetical protein [Arenimonas sp.]|uniref:hypothetical protein n=1 Tax=Arenimonas sp. TaxID=1872635 RepID=UPI0035AFB2BB